MTFQVASVPGDEVHAPLALLEKSLRAGTPLPEPFVVRVGSAVGEGELEVLAAWSSTGDVVGVAILCYRLSISAGQRFASLEELYVKPEARRRGVGRSLVEMVGVRCEIQGVSYVEVQTIDEEARAFYAALGYEQEAEVRVMSRSYPL